jgi:hypothetical protein
VLACALLLAAGLVAQLLDRSSGRVLTNRGEPLRGAEVRVEAISGFAGSDSKLTTS